MNVESYCLLGITAFRVTLLTASINTVPVSGSRPEKVWISVKLYMPNRTV